MVGWRSSKTTASAALGFGVRHSSVESVSFRWVWVVACLLSVCECGTSLVCYFVGFVVVFVVLVCVFGRILLGWWVTVG